MAENDWVDVGTASELAGRAVGGGLKPGRGRLTRQSIRTRPRLIPPEGLVARTR